MLSKNKKEAIKEFIEFHKEIEEETSGRQGRRKRKVD